MARLPHPLPDHIELRSYRHVEIEERRHAAQETLDVGEWLQHAAEHRNELRLAPMLAGDEVQVGRDVPEIGTHVYVPLQTRIPTTALVPPVDEGHETTNVTLPIAHTAASLKAITTLAAAGGPARDCLIAVTT